ncbi:PDZ domain-containing protein [Microbulbifer sp. M83]|uniref:PDZ domain-containing protein n=1 Tax=Microbulbifer sp. M83 TaxID=3118246 RepID=UPI002FE42868
MIFASRRLNLALLALLVAIPGGYLAIAAGAPDSTAGALADGRAGRLAQIFTGDGDLESRVARLEESLARSNEIQSQMLDLVEELRQQLEGEVDNEPRTRRAAISEGDGQRHSRRRAHSQDFHEMQLQQLVEAGIDPARAAHILERQERFQYEHMKISYAYRHTPNKSSPEAMALREKLESYSHPRKMLEHELSAEEFERYLEATSGSQNMEINDVISGAPAAAAGLRPGDRIISYNGERIFHMGDLRSQVYKVAPGENVAVEIQRRDSGSRETIYLPSGPLGIRG